MLDHRVDTSAVRMAHNEKEDEDSGPKKPKGGPRKRVSQACDKCRIRKDKCDGKKPSCTTVSASTVLSYVADEFVPSVLPTPENAHTKQT